MSLEHPILAIDHGESRIGIAASDPVGIIAHPVSTIPNNEKAIEEILNLLKQRQIKGIVIGLPLRMDGSEGSASLKIRKFKNDLRRALPSAIPIELVDERLTTLDASHKLREAGKKAKQQKEIIDQAAAVEILNAYMQANSNPFGLLEDPDAPKW